MTSLGTPPCAFSIRKDDKSYCPQWRSIGRTFDVLVDGKVITKVVAYDCAEGWVRRLVTDDAGRPVLAPSWDCVMEEVLRGAVTVIWCASAA